MGVVSKAKREKNIYLIFIISPWSFFQVQLIFLSEIVSGQHAYFLSFSSFLKLQSRPTDIIQRVQVIVPVWQGSCFQITGVRRQAWASKMPPNKILSHIDPEFCSLLMGEGKTDASACKWLRPAEWGLWQSGGPVPSLRWATALLLCQFFPCRNEGLALHLFWFFLRAEKSRCLYKSPNSRSYILSKICFFFKKNP